MVFAELDDKRFDSWEVTSYPKEDVYTVSILCDGSEFYNEGHKLSDVIQKAVRDALKLDDEIEWVNFPVPLCGESR